MKRSRRMILACVGLCTVALAYYGGACGGDGTGGGGGGVTSPTLEAVRTALAADNPFGMVPGLALGAITLPECTAESASEEITYAVTGLPAWLAFDATTRALTLAGGATVVPPDGNTSAEITYTCSTGTAAATSVSMQVGDEPSEASVTFVVNDLDGGGVVDGMEYEFGAVPLLNNTAGWIWLTPGNVDLYRTPEASPRKIPTGIVVTSVGMNPTDPADDTGDFDGDTISNADEITNGTNMFVALSSGNLANSGSFAAGTTPKGIAAADLNGDGFLDLVVSNEEGPAPGGIRSFINDGSGVFTLVGDYATDWKPVGIALADLNGDGFIDAVNASRAISSAVWVLLGNGDGTFGTPTHFGAGNDPSDVVAADFNDDGIVDLALPNETSNDVSILIGKGDGTFNAATNVAVGNGPLALAYADVDVDGDLDLATANYNDSTISVLINAGDGTFTAGSTPAVGGTANGVTAGDFDGDGDIDLASSNYGSAESVTVLLNNGDGSFAAHVDYPVPSYKPNYIVSADLDGDGDLDIAITNTYDVKLAIFPGNGDGTLGTMVQVSPQAERFGIVAADFNADGKVDLATSEDLNNMISVFLNQ